MQRFLDVAFELIDEKGTTEFTIQEVIDRSKQSLRSFYEYFDGKDELVLALFEETMSEAGADIRAAVDAQSDPLATARLHDLPARVVRSQRGAARNAVPHHRRAISEFAMHLAVKYPERVRAALAPVSHLLRTLVDDAARPAHDPRRRHAAGRPRSCTQTVMYSWFGNRLVDNPESRLTAEETWQFCLQGLRG